MAETKTVAEKRTRRDITAARREQALELRAVHGLAYRKIGLKLGVSHQEASNLVKDAIQNHLKHESHNAATLIAMETRRLDYIAQKFIEVIEGEEVTDKDKNAANAGLLALSESRRRMFGLDKDTQRFVDVEVASRMGLVVSQIAAAFWRVVAGVLAPDVAQQIAQRMLAELAPMTPTQSGPTIQLALSGPNGPEALDPADDEEDETAGASSPPQPQPPDLFAGREVPPEVPR